MTQPNAAILDIDALLWAAKAQGRRAQAWRCALETNPFADGTAQHAAWRSAWLAAAAARGRRAA